MFLAQLIDVDALWKIVLIAFAGGVGVTAVFGWMILRAQALDDARRRRESGTIVLNGAAVAVAAALCFAALVVGFIAMTHK